MNQEALRECIRSSLDPRGEIRSKAESDLREAEIQPGFIGNLLDIVNNEPEPQAQQSAVIYLKNRTTKGWARVEDEGMPADYPIAEAERPPFRDRLIQSLVLVPPQIRAQLLPVLQRILQHDFPQRWPNYVEHCRHLLSSPDVASVYAGTQCILAVCRVYRFKSGNHRKELDPVIRTCFPRMLDIANGLIAETSTEAGDILKTIIKSFKHATYFELPRELQSKDVMVAWCTLFIQTISKDAPPEAMGEDLDERESNTWWKAKKWAYANLNRLFVRYGSPNQLSSGNGDEYQAFSRMFLSDFAPDILRTYLSEIEKWAAKTSWLSRHCLASTITFLDECIKPKAIWNLLQPHLETIVRHVIFPVMCISDSDIELFEDDPTEFIQKKFTYYDEVSSPDMAATGFLITLTQHRKKQTFTVLNFINDIVNTYETSPENEKDPKKKEGALRMTGTLAPVMLGKKSPIANQVEYFFVRHVFPEFRSPKGYLRARACDMVEKFQELEFENQANLVLVYRNILESMADSELPVRLEAALALQPLIKHQIVKESMQQQIPSVMQQLLSLANEVDVDALANVMEEFVEVFATELTPFAVALTEQLRDTYLRIVRELLERANGDSEAFAELYDDKSITALGVLQTIGTLFLTLESTPDVMLHLETVLMPIISITLENKLYDLFNEVFEIIDSCTFSAKNISETMWQAFELIHQTFKDGAELYLEDMLPALENYISYGHERLVQNPLYTDALVGMIDTIFSEKKAGGVDRICGCKLAEGLMVHLRGNLDRHVQRFVTLAMTTLLANDNKVKSLRIHLMEMVINAIYYNPRLALPWLEANGWTNRFFSMWFAQLDLFTRVHDKKLGIAAIVACLGLGPDEIPASIQVGWPRLLSGAVRLFQTLPAAVKKREETIWTEQNGEAGSDGQAGEDEEEWSNEVVWDEEDVLEDGGAGGADGKSSVDDATEDVKKDPYLEFLTQEAKRIAATNGANGIGGRREEDEEELEEENLLETPLERLEPYALFRNVLLNCQQEHPNLYSQLTQHLTPDETQVLQDVIIQAETKLTAEAQAEAQRRVLAAATPYQQQSGHQVAGQQSQAMPSSQIGQPPQTLQNGDLPQVTQAGGVNGLSNGVTSIPQQQQQGQMGSSTILGSGLQPVPHSAQQQVQQQPIGGQQPGL